MEKFYDKEQPELVIAKSGEVRLYKTGKRLAVSKPSWSNSDGVHMGKTVSIDLAANEGNQELVQVLQNAIEILQTVKSTQA